MIRIPKIKNLSLNTQSIYGNAFVLVSFLKTIITSAMIAGSDIRMFISLVGGLLMLEGAIINAKAQMKHAKDDPSLLVAYMIIWTCAVTFVGIQWYYQVSYAFTAGQGIPQNVVDYLSKYSIAFAVSLYILTFWAASFASTERLAIWRERRLDRAAQKAVRAFERKSRMLTARSEYAQTESEYRAQKRARLESKRQHAIETFRILFPQKITQNPIPKIGGDSIPMPPIDITLTHQPHKCLNCGNDAGTTRIYCTQDKCQKAVRRAISETIKGSLDPKYRQIHAQVSRINPQIISDIRAKHES